ncbi:hypothetical protein [Rummeliibacillus pycnus]|uniref:hypothetical protein n=1 Tax=Rummeliibacillus pycnus TaxID=101070 RepID=UPI0037CC52FF
MKTKVYTKILSSAVAISLVLGSASFASAKGSDHGKSEHQPKGQVQEEVENSNTGENEKEEKDQNKKDQNKKDQSEKNQKNQSKKELKNKTVSKSKFSKTVEKRLNNVDSTITKLSKSINSFFAVSEDGTVDKDLSKKVATKKYKSYTGKLKAEINKLRAIDKQLSSDKRKNRLNASDYEILSTKSKELQQLATDEIKRVKSLAEQSTTPKTDHETTTTEPKSDDNNEQADSQEQDNNEQANSEDDGEQVDSVDEE